MSVASLFNGWAKSMIWHECCRVQLPLCEWVTPIILQRRRNAIKIVRFSASYDITGFCIGLKWIGQMKPAGGCLGSLARCSFTSFWLATAGNCIFLVRKNRIAMLHDHRAKLAHEFMHARSTLLIILAVASNQVAQIIWSIPRIASLRLMLVRCGVLKRLALLNNGKS